MPWHLGDQAPLWGRLGDGGDGVEVDTCLLRGGFGDDELLLRGPRERFEDDARRFGLGALADTQ
eukprot:2097485-Pyramimonas_sp.AAC.1